MKLFSPKISCIVLTHNSNVGKADSVLHTLSSIFNQDYLNFELILIENSKIKSKRLMSAINNLINIRNRKENPIETKIINLDKSKDMGSSRNIGAGASTGEILLFMDDDTIILGKDAFSRIAKLSKKYDSGYGAKRLWTKSDLFQQNSEAILKELNEGKTILIEKVAGLPPKMLRGLDQSQSLLSNTFITNFGFCTKDLFLKLGCYPSYAGRGFHDDCLMYRLYRSKSKTILLDDIKVVHVNHDINNRFDENFQDYWSDLIKDGYYWFHIEKVFDRKNYRREVILEDLSPLHFDERIENAYKLYKKLFALDIGSNEKKQSVWKLWYQESIITFVQKLYILLNSNSLDNFVKNSNSDFDNIAPLISSAIESNVLHISKTGKIKPNIIWKYDNIKSEVLVFEPLSDFNQFPCDEESIKRRVEFIRSRYPYCRYLRLGIIGDDDLMSIHLSGDYWIWPTIVELDKRITKKLKMASKRFTIIEEDISRLLNRTEKLNSYKLQTFITDPPYTLNGSLAFIVTGLKMLDINKEKKEFYVILNRTMMGENLNKLLTICSESKINLTDVIPNFSSYRLPKKFAEKVRSDRYLKSLDIEKKSLAYSSSSSLYIFNTKCPDIKKLERVLDVSKMYTHY